MKLSVKGLSTLCALGLLASPSIYASEQPGVANKNQDEAALAPYRQAAKSLGMALKGELQKAMQSGGPLAAVEVCNQKAGLISDSVTKAQADGWLVRRTSAKLRNLDNAPLTEQEAAHINSTNFTAGSEIFETVQKDGKPHHLYMKAIGTQPVCLACHGDNIAPALAAKIDALYPEDKARGYKVGDVRGAFVVYAPVKD
jgi:hypothetical protein